MEESQKIENAKKRVEKLLIENATTEFFIRNFINLNTTITMYNTLKQVYKNKSRELNQYEDFEKAFSKFYAMGRFVSKDFIKNYYTVLNELRDITEYDVRRLTEKLMSGEKIQFSFTTKMLNIMNDEKYPIYDSYVARAFGLYPADSGNMDEKIDRYILNYNIITETYENLLVHYQYIISDFRQVFKCSKSDLSDMRIIDIIIWQLGEKIINNKIKI